MSELGFAWPQTLILLHRGKRTGKRASRGEGESTSADWLSLAAIGFCDVTK